MKSCLALVNDGKELEELHSLLDEPKEDSIQYREVNHVHRKIKTGRELCMNAQIGDYKWTMSYYIKA